MPISQDYPTYGSRNGLIFARIFIGLIDKLN